MPYTTLSVDRKPEGYAVITLNRPDKLNALSMELIGELGAATTELLADASVRGLIITGAGKAFAAGADIAELNALGGESGTAYSMRGQSVFLQIERARFPVIAAVNGFALGGGCELAMSCHIRLAGEKAKFAQPEVNLGIIPGFGGTQRLTRLVGLGRSVEMNLTGDIIDAVTAERIGLVNAVHTTDELMMKAEELMKKILTKGPTAVRNALRAVVDSIDLPTDEGMAIEAILFGETCATADFKEGTRAFLEKRAASFIGER